MFLSDIFVSKVTVSVLKAIRRTTPKTPGYVYTKDDVFAEYKKKSASANETQFIYSLVFLAENGFIKTGESDGVNAFVLTEKGMYYDEYLRGLRWRYFVDHLLEIIAAVLSVIAIIVSVKYRS